jgi:hypothetical protein
VQLCFVLPKHEGVLYETVLRSCMKKEVLITTQKMKLFMHSLGLSQKLLTPFKWLLTNNFKALGRKSVVYLEGTLYLSNFPPRKWEGYYMLTPQ